MKFYHYTPVEKFIDMEFGYGYGKTGLIPLRRVLPSGMARKFNLSEKAEGVASFGLIDPLDITWCQNTFFPDEPLLETIADRLPTDRTPQIHLLKVAATPEDDVYVADYSPHLRARYKTRRGYGKITEQVKLDYWNSFVPLAEYLKGGFKHGIPEVVCFSPIPFDRLRVERTMTKRELAEVARKLGGLSPLPILRKPTHPEATKKAQGSQLAHK